MTQFEYAVTVYTTTDILERLPDAAAAAAPSTLYCDVEGECFFDAAPNPYVAAMVEILNLRGAEGWSLVQVVPRQDDMICFWRREQ